MLKRISLVHVLAVVVVLSILMAYFIPTCGPVLCTARQGVADHLIDNLETAAKNYQIDWGVYPPGTGEGSAELARHLQLKGPKNLPYFEFFGEMLDGKGNIINPVFPGEDGPEEIIHYRNNSQPGGVATPPARRKKSFDMWCAGYVRPDDPITWE